MIWQYIICSIIHEFIIVFTILSAQLLLLKLTLYGSFYYLIDKEWNKNDSIDEDMYFAIFFIVDNVFVMIS
jgi:hypothetical protein